MLKRNIHKKKNSYQKKWLLQNFLVLTDQNLSIVLPCVKQSAFSTELNGFFFYWQRKWNSEMSVHSNHNRWLVLMLCQRATKNSVLTLFNLTSVFLFSALSSLISYGADKENLFVNQELLNLVITAFILMTFMFDSRVLLQGEIRSQLPLGLRLSKSVPQIFQFF